MFKNPFSFNRRIRRTEFGLTYIIYLVFLGIIDFLILEFNITILYILYIPAIWFFIAQGAKRCHDRSNSGWYQIIPFYVLFMLFADSIYGPNEFGLNPKREGNHDNLDQIGIQELS
ncbi:Uncharacterized membrane protein YhaH, DUF805 family [Tenacibaculum sp. MAR_2009_124]|uniref:DUF805 domain-containing protein n=1 Tax=Tenacibaculum sp. MAR_2009_124 TaxID=1250059 RepID=UPI0008977BC7|nr:DUF805 domain-containing protein [Tenacibaculum sp. MAR_2009_124]SEB52507.1 Uncharacterized membrane protein YhaH, DUF805 family [Tenacibaculum sp. MAR_2009_124]